MNTFQWILIIVSGVAALCLFVGLPVVLSRFHKVRQGSAIVRTGHGGTMVRFSGIFVWPLLHRMEVMDITVKRIEIARLGVDGLVCQDNMRADVKVAFFVRVNKTEQDVLQVAQALGTERGSDVETLKEFFDPKFSEALKTVGKRFDFVELYTNRDTFKEEILKVIGTDLNGYVLDDAAIDYLEQTSLTHMDPTNILDAEGIKKITDLTAAQAILANDITRNKEKVIKRQDVEARETILELERQQIDAEQKQAREITEVTAREDASGQKIFHEELLKKERARIITEEEVAIATENKDRQVIVARKNKERADVVETERVRKDQELEATERERIVALTRIEKDKMIEVEQRNIQEVIRERVAVQRTVVEEEENIKNTREFAAADRSKQVALTKAAEDSEQGKIRQTVAAEAAKDAAVFAADQKVIEAQAQRDAAEKQADGRKVLADAMAEEAAVLGVGEARALEARAGATAKFGQAEASVIEKKATAEAVGIQALAGAEADGIEKKAEAMKLFDAVGKEHEEFKLNLNKDLQVELAEITVQKDIAAEQATIVGEALKSAKIDIVGGESVFFDKIVSAITQGKSVDRIVDNSHTLSDIKRTLFTGDSETFTRELKRFAGQFGMSSEDLKNLTVSAMLTKMTSMTDDAAMQQTLDTLFTAADKMGVGNKIASSLLDPKKK